MKEKAEKKGVIVKRWKNRIPVCVVYPDSYYTGMSNLALHVLYATLNKIDSIVCERAFFEKNEEILSLETKKPLSSFEILFFTVSYELNYINILRILSNSKIPLRSKERKENEPLIVGGGIVLIANPEPVSEFFDLIICGDVEATIPEFIDSYLMVRNKNKRRILEELSKFSWVYNPSYLEVSYDDEGKISAFDPPDFKVHVKYYRGKRLGHSVILTEETEFSNMYLVEGTRGCPARCPFCLLGNLYPFRAEKGTLDELSKEEANDIGIIGGGVLYIPNLITLLRSLKEKDKRIHLPSLRLDKISYELIELIKDDVKTLTFGVEAGSFHMRAALGKPFTDDEIKNRIGEILEIAPFNLKLYFMIGLPYEKMEDVESIFELSKEIRHVIVKKMAPRGFLPKLTVHISPFVPKPKTPLQWAKMEDWKVLEDKIKWLKNKFAKLGTTFFTYDSVKYVFLQAVLARGDRRVSQFIAKLLNEESIKKVMSLTPINLGFYAYREREEDEILPWDFIEGGRKKELLLRDFKRYMSVLPRLSN